MVLVVRMVPYKQVAIVFPFELRACQSASSADSVKLRQPRSDQCTGYWRRDMHLAVLRIDSDQYGSSRTLDCVSAPLVDKMLVCLPRMGFPDAERQSILSFRDRASGKLSLHDTDGMWVSNMYVIHFGS